MDHLPVLPVIDALELLAAADGPVHSVGVQAQLLFQLLTQLEGIMFIVVDYPAPL